MFTVDLHSHILPGLDDGARDTDESLVLLRCEADQGIKSIVLSPHFDPLAEDTADFVRRRDASYASLKQTLAAGELAGAFDLRPAAEIRYCPMLPELPELGSLCISGTNVLLVEFSFAHGPEFAREVFSELQSKGYIILIAHIERYDWLRRAPDLLYDLVRGGAYAQVNADSITGDKGSLAFIRKMLKYGLVHGIGSDTHNMDKRPPMLEKAAEILAADPGEETVSCLENAGKALLGGNIPSAFIPERPRISFWDLFRK